MAVAAHWTGLGAARISRPAARCSRVRPVRRPPRRVSRICPARRSRSCAPRAGRRHATSARCGSPARPSPSSRRCTAAHGPAPRARVEIHAGPARPAACGGRGAAAGSGSEALTFQDLIFKLSQFWVARGLRPAAAARPRGRRRHVPSRDAAPRPRPGALERRLRPAARAGPTTAASARTRTACSSTTSSRSS